MGLPKWKLATHALGQADETSGAVCARYVRWAQSRTTQIMSKVERARLKREERLQQRASGVGSTTPAVAAQRSEKRVGSQWRLNDPKCAPPPDLEGVSAA